MYGGRAHRPGRSSPDLDSQYESTNRSRLTGRDVLGYGELPSLAMILTTLASYATKIACFTIGATLSDKLTHQKILDLRTRTLTFTATTKTLNSMLVLSLWSLLGQEYFQNEILFVLGKRLFKTTKLGLIIEIRISDLCPFKI